MSLDRDPVQASSSQATLRAAIATAEAGINDRVYRLFGLDKDEIALIESSLIGQYCACRRNSFMICSEYRFYCGH